MTILAQPLRIISRTSAFSSSHVLRRSYALSRFPTDKGPGGYRQRSPELPIEEKPSIEQSDLWEQSLRRPSINPEEGLRKLLLYNDVLVVTRQIEMLNIFVGFEQANRYLISNVEGEPLGYIAEEPRGILSTFSRQLFRTHRPFRALVMDLEGSPILWLRRPFAWINSRMHVQRLKDFNAYTEDEEPILDTFGEVQQRWHLWRRRYDLFLRESSAKRILSTPTQPQPEPDPASDLYYQIARIDGGFWAWYFGLLDESGNEFASVSRKFRGIGREVRTSGQYFIRFGPQPEEEVGAYAQPAVTPAYRTLTLDERAVCISLVLATAVNIDFDYFSRHSGEGCVHSECLSPPSMY
ncbi:Scramblase-domain-containing protein [Punctularia strigosozonata HHB-11173 SS5]|uniref:Scramblase-domain-containing protein n=1 Tax=Punctularia strigosozonata (strain HHB-11173) TaxID=741275 RepID=UPI0004416DEF|nr:Scramblase-domain-containing protein [Punctularia strigosozonata HHB-11173 SS5]EIN07750.1 Scramblase-domain-containing protein [Punctularia strigosozonata HHB-11173 SS5]